MMFRRAGWLLLAAPFFGFSTGALFPLVALELNRLGFGEAFVGSVTSLYYAGSVTGALTYGWILNRVGYKGAGFQAESQAWLGVSRLRLRLRSAAELPMPVFMV